MLFRSDFPVRGYDGELMNKALEYASGLPLAIVKLGSFLYNRKSSEWNTALVEFKRVANDMVMKVLIRSFLVLDISGREMFLDIACFFVGKEIKYVEKILECDIQSLIEKSLVSVTDNKIQMHSLLQEMGKEIVRHAFPSEPDKWRRLWDFNDVDKVMQIDAVSFATLFSVKILCYNNALKLK